VVGQIAEVEGPLHKDVVIDRIRLCYGLGRIRGATRERVDDAIESAVQSGRIKSDGAFIWAWDEQLDRSPRQPADGSIDHVPPSELKAVVLATARVMFGMARPDLLVEVARTLGFGRAGSRITEVIDAAIQQLIGEGKLVESFGMLRTTT
jgi:hypothetical protein